MKEIPHTKTKVCRYCYKMALTLSFISPKIVFVPTDPSEKELTMFTVDTTDYEFTPDHEECSCCAAQIRVMKKELERMLKERPDMPKEAQERIVRCCCH